MFAIGAVGLLMIFFSAVMIASPSAWSRGIIAFAAKPYFHVLEITSRLFLGGVLIYFAQSARYPLLIKILGGVFVFAGVFLIAAGSKRHRDFAARSATFLKLFRPAGIAGVILGGFIIYIAATR